MAVTKLPMEQIQIDRICTESVMVAQEPPSAYEACFILSVAQTRGP